MVSLRFGDFPQHAVNTVKSLFNDSNSDVTLTCGSEGQINAHKFLLSSASPVFEKILSECSVTPQTIYMRGFQYEDLSALVQYMYLGEVYIPVDKLDSFISTALELKIKGLTNEKCSTVKSEQQLPKWSLHTLSKLKRSDEEERKAHPTSENNIEVSPLYNPYYSEESKKYQCGQCELSFNNKATLQHHINKQHLKIRFNCEICNQYETQSAVALKKHKANEHGQLNAMLKCPKCEYKSAKSSKLREHILNIHEGARYPCAQCSYVANSYGNLQSHKKSQHNGIRYQCDLCNHQSTRKQYLKKHKESAHK